MAAHDGLPLLAAVPGGIGGLATDRCRIDEQLRPRQGHHAHQLRKPLVPADPSAELDMAGPPDLRPLGAGREEGVLLIAGELGDVAFAVDAQQLAIGIDNCERVVERVLCPLSIGGC